MFIPSPTHISKMYPFSSSWCVLLFCLLDLSASIWECGSADTGIGTRKNITVQNDYVLAGYNNSLTSGFATIIIKSRATSESIADPITLPTQTYVFPDQYISRACGNHISRCLELTILERTVSDNLPSVRYITILVPLEGGIGLMDFQDVGKQLKHQMTHVMELPNLIGFIPLSIVQYKESYYVICLQESNRFFSCLIMIDESNITLSRLQCTSVGRPLLSSIDLNSISNFVHLGEEFISFAIDNALFKLFPVRSAITRYGSTLPDNVACSRLVHDESKEVIFVYYREEDDVYVIPYDTIDEYWEFLYLNEHLIHPCPDGHEAIVFPNSSAILFSSSLDQVEVHRSIIGTKFIIGKCFGEGVESSRFVYIDRSKGTYVLDVNTGENVQISNAVCSSNNCGAPLVYQDDYVILREITNSVNMGGPCNIADSVVRITLHNAKRGFEKTAQIKDVTSPLVGFVRGLVYQHVLSSGGMGPNTERGNVMSSITFWLITVLLIGACLVFLIGGIVVMGFWTRSVKSRRNKTLEQRRDRSYSPPDNASRERLILSTDTAEGIPLHLSHDVPHDRITTHEEQTRFTRNRETPVGAHGTSHVTAIGINDSNEPAASETSPPSSTHSPALSQQTDHTVPQEQSGAMNVISSNSPTNQSSSPQDSIDIEQLYPDRGSLPVPNSGIRDIDHHHSQSQVADDDNSTHTPSQSPDFQPSDATHSPSMSPGLSRANYQIEGASSSTENLMAPTQATRSESHPNLRPDGPSVLHSEPRPSTALNQHQEPTLTRNYPNKSECSSSQTVTTSEATRSSSVSDYTPCSSLFGLPSQALPSPSQSLCSGSQYTMPITPVSTTNPLYSSTVSTNGVCSSPHSLTTSQQTNSAPQEHCQPGSINTTHSDNSTDQTSLLDTDTAEVKQLCTARCRLPNSEGSNTAPSDHYHFQFPSVPSQSLDSINLSKTSLTSTPSFSSNMSTPNN